MKIEDVNVEETNWISSLETKRGPLHIIIVTIPSLENTSDEILSNRPYLSIGILVVSFQFHNFNEP